MSNPSLFSLQQRRILITGSYRGLGLAIARGLARAGATVVINGRNGEGVANAVEALRADQLDAHGAVFDITDEASVVDALGRIRKDLGPLHGLVNNAGIQRRHPLHEMPVEDFRLVLETNLTAAFLTAKHVVPEMMERGSGKIINMCSLMSDLARPTTGNYAAAKAGLRMLTRSMAAEWAAHGLQINAIGPGYFETEMTRPLKEDPDFNEWICGRTPAGRWGNPEELQGVAVFLASDASSFINGQIIYVDGGLTAVI
jgi:gluconate 5-dehydrogenase